MNNSQITFTKNFMQNSIETIAKLKAELKNPRVRKVQGRLDAIAQHESVVKESLFNLYMAGVSIEKKAA